MITLENTLYRENISVEEILSKAPIPITKAMDFLNTLHVDLKSSVKLLTVLMKTIQVLNFKRVSFVELGKKRLINLYGIALAPSGSGKDRTLHDLSRHIFNKILEKNQVRIDEHMQFLKDEIEKNYSGKEAKQFLKKLRTLTLETGNATPEGIFEDAFNLSKTTFGSIFIKISELGLALSGNEGRKFLGNVFSCYDGNFDSKSIKSEDRKGNLELIPVSILGVSDPNDFFRGLNQQVKSMLETGLSRRAFFAFQATLYKTQIDPMQERKKIQDANWFAGETAEMLDNIVESIPIGASYEITNEAYDNVFAPYKNYLIDLSNSVSDDILKKEVQSRELKALNVGCMYACLNHPTWFVITEADMEQAIQTVQFLSQDLKQFINFVPTKFDGYDKFYNFLKQNEGTKFAKTVLINQHHNELGFSRKTLRKDYENIIQIVNETANLRGYKLVRGWNHNNTGTQLWLEKIGPDGHKGLINFVVH